MSNDAERQSIEDNTLNRRQFLRKLARGAAVGGGVLAAGKVGYDWLSNGVDRPVMGEVTTQPEPSTLSVDTLPPTTTTQPEIVERRYHVPNQYLGSITLNVSGAGPNGQTPSQNVVTVPLHFESRTLEQAQNNVPMSEDDPELLRGAMLHIDTTLPGAFTRAEAANSHTMPVISAHRLTPVNGLSHGPFYDIDKLTPGDALTINYDSGKSFTYKQVRSGFAPVGDELFDELFQQTNKDLLAIYACADANGQTGNGTFYDASNRYYAVFERAHPAH